MEEYSTGTRGTTGVKAAAQLLSPAVGGHQPGPTALALNCLVILVKPKEGNHLLT